MAAPVVPNTSCLELSETAIEKDNFADWVRFHYITFKPKAKILFIGQSKY